MTTIRDEGELPAPSVLVKRVIEGEEIEVPNPIRQICYLRSLSDPRFYIHGTTGEGYVRSDGLMWEHPAYRVGLSKTDSIEREMGTAYGDSKQYPYVKQQAAA